MDPRVEPEDDEVRVAQMQSDYFSLLGISPGFDLDEKALEAAYIAKQREYHPDRLAKTDMAARRKAIQLSAEINQAYQILKTPLSRAEYLLWQHGIEVHAEKGGVKPSQAILMESLEVRERLMEASSAEEINRLRDESTATITRLWEAFRRAYQQKDWQNAAQTVIHLTFLTKFLNEIRVREKTLT